MRLASSASAGGCYLLLSIYALGGERNVIRALALSWLVTLWNPSLGPIPSGGTAGRFLVIAAGTLSCFLRWKGLRGEVRVSIPVLATFGLGMFFVAHSFLFSSHVEISVLKAISWSAATVTLVCAWGRAENSHKDIAPTQLRNLLLFVLIASVPFFRMWQGYLRNGTGFQGILSHPQIMGPTMALLAALLLSEVILQTKPSWWRLGALSVALAFVLASEARTGAFAFMIGVGLAWLHQASQSKGRGQGSSKLPGLKSRRLLLSLLFGVLLGMTQLGRVTEGWKGFVEKRGGSGEVMHAYEDSRGSLIADMWGGFLKHPVVGNGFGLPRASKQFEISYNAATGIPTAAPVEKGVLPVAILEDLGLLGAALIALWLWGVVRRASHGGLAVLSIVLTALLTNMGEATLFSAGGMGLLIINCVAWGASYRIGGAIHTD